MPRCFIIIAVAAIAFSLAACGDSPSSSVASIGGSGSTTTTLPAASGSGGDVSIQQLYQDAIAYAGCMQSHGDPSFSPPTTVVNASEQIVGWPQPGDLKGDPAALSRYNSANRTCETLLPNSGAGPSQAQVQQQLSEDLKFSRCMRAHGLASFPDPKATKQGISISSSHPIDPRSPASLAAQRACQSLVPFP